MRLSGRVVVSEFSVSIKTWFPTRFLTLKTKDLFLRRFNVMNNTKVTYMIVRSGDFRVCFRNCGGILQVLLILC
jgi:hypothetical protein